MLFLNSFSGSPTKSEMKMEPIWKEQVGGWFYYSFSKHLLSRWCQALIWHYQGPWDNWHRSCLREKDMNRQRQQDVVDVTGGPSVVAAPLKLSHTHLSCVWGSSYTQVALSSWNRRCLVRQKKKKMRQTQGDHRRAGLASEQEGFQWEAGSLVETPSRAGSVWGRAFWWPPSSGQEVWSQRLAQRFSKCLGEKRWDRVGQWECLEEGSPGGDGEGAETKGFPGWVARRGGLSGSGDLCGRGGMRERGGLPRAAMGIALS